MINIQELRFQKIAACLQITNASQCVTVSILRNIRAPSHCYVIDIQDGAETNASGFSIIRLLLFRGRPILFFLGLARNLFHVS